MEAFGPLTSWALECSPASKNSSAKSKDAAAAAGGANVVLVTPKGRYVASKPLPGYKKVFAGIEEQAVLVHEVLQVRGGWSWLCFDVSIRYYPTNT